MPFFARALPLAVMAAFLMESSTAFSSHTMIKGAMSQLHTSAASQARGNSFRLYAEAKKKKKVKKKVAGASVAKAKVKKASAKKKTAGAKNKQVEKRDLAVAVAEPAAGEAPAATIATKIVEVEPPEEMVPVAKEKLSPYDENGVFIGPRPRDPDTVEFDLTGGRPGAIIESIAELDRKDEICEEMDSGKRKYPEWINNYGEPDEDALEPYDTDDPEAIDMATLGQYNIYDLLTPTDLEWDPAKDPDPNEIKDPENYLQETAKDDDGVEIGYDPIFGPSNPIDLRAKTGLEESYMVNDLTRDDRMLPPEFNEGDVELKYNSDVTTFRKSLDIIDTYVDEYLGEEVPVPRHSAKWFGYPELTKYPRKPYTNNRFTKPEDLTNFDAMTPARARERAVELARSQNPEWMPAGLSHEWHANQRRIYDEIGTLVGSTRPGHCDPDIVERIQPALKILGASAKLLSIENETVFRFHYFGLMKNKHGMGCWTETLIRDCGVEVTGVVMEAGYRKRDPAYDGGDPYYGPHW